MDDHKENMLDDQEHQENHLLQEQDGKPKHERNISVDCSEDEPLDLSTKRRRSPSPSSKCTSGFTYSLRVSGDHGIKRMRLKTPERVSVFSRSPDFLSKFNHSSDFSSCLGRQMSQIPQRHHFSLIRNLNPYQTPIESSRKSTSPQRESPRNVESPHDSLLTPSVSSPEDSRLNLPSSSYYNPFFLPNFNFFNQQNAFSQLLAAQPGTSQSRPSLSQFLFMGAQMAFPGALPSLNPFPLSSLLRMDQDELLPQQENYLKSREELLVAKGKKLQKARQIHLQTSKAHGIKIHHEKNSNTNNNNNDNNNDRDNLNDSNRSNDNNNSFRSEDDSKGEENRTKSSSKDIVKDKAYWIKKKKNNLAAKKSRDAKKEREKETAANVAELEKKILRLETEQQYFKNNVQQRSERIILEEQQASQNVNEDVFPK